MAIEKLKDHYITPELIQSYELEFNEMYQGDQEHPQIFLARLREAADLANITSEEVIQSRFRAGLLKEIKQFCIQSSSKSFQDWIVHAEGWWNANRPRKIAMVDNPFIPRNINNALIYHDDNTCQSHYAINNHNVELIDTDERPTPIISVNGVSNPARMMYPNIANGPAQLTTMDIIGHTNDTQYQVHHHPRHYHNESLPRDKQHGILNMVQQVVRSELNSFYQPNRVYNPNTRGNYHNFNENHRGHQRNDEYFRYRNNNENGHRFNKGNSGYNNNGYNNNGYNNNGYNNNGYNNSNYNNNGYNNNGYNSIGYSNSNYNNNGHNNSGYNNSNFNNRYNKFRNNDNYANERSDNNRKKLNGSVAFNENNGQSNTQKTQKSIKPQLRPQNLNVILTQKEEDYNEKELYSAIRPERPPEVGRGVPYTKPKNSSQKKPIKAPAITRKVTTRSHLEEIKPTTSSRITPTQDIEMETDLPIEPIQKKATTKRVQPDVNYNIVTDVLDKPANISVRDLIATTPKYRKELIGACRPKRLHSKTNKDQQTVALIEDEDINTTAVYSRTSIGDHSIKTLIDCGAAKTCISKVLADTLKLKIDAPSESIFTLGNGTKQPALGIIYDVPIEVKENLVIPCNIEVLPSCPSHLIIGNNWLNRAKAKIDFNSSTLKVAYKDQKAELPITFLRKKERVPKMVTYTQNYQNPISLTNSSPKRVHFEDEATENTEESHSEELSNSEETSDEDYSAEDEASDDELGKADSLLVLEEEKEQKIELLSEEARMIIRAPEEGMTIKAYSSCTFRVEKPSKGYRKLIYGFDITNQVVLNAMCCFDINSNIIINRRNIEIHIYNRSEHDIFLNPYEEIGKLEEYNLEEEEMVQAYQLNRNYDLFALEEEVIENSESDNETISPEMYAKLEVGHIESDVKKKLQKLMHRYKDIFDWNNDTIGYTDIIQHKIVIEENTQPISHRPYRLSPVESDYLLKELDKYCKLGVIAPSNSPWAAPVIL
ncbi:hypothetical protein G6F26_011948 [Rhizopus arrhizus]|nr:hypothetical protein G6F26_011948 [Rhizopus arrhizus]